MHTVQNTGHRLWGVVVNYMTIIHLLYLLVIA